MSRVVTRTAIYTFVYVSISVAFPSVPIGGIRLVVMSISKLIGGIAYGASGEAKDQVTHYVDQEKDHIVEGIKGIPGEVWDFLNPFK